MLKFLEKLAIFNSLNQMEKESIFGYKQTFVSYIRQLISINPKAKILISSIPISPLHMTGELNSDGHGIRKEGWNASRAEKEGMPKYVSISKDSRDVAKWLNINWVDLKNKVGLTFNNSHLYCSDGTHWFPEIIKRIGLIISNELIKMEFKQKRCYQL